MHNNTETELTSSLAPMRWNRIQLFLLQSFVLYGDFSFKSTVVAGSLVQYVAPIWYFGVD